MSDIKLITTYLNTLLIAGSFSGKPFKKGKFYGIAELVEKTALNNDDVYTIPIVLDADGSDGSEVVINDIYPFQLYHRITSIESGDAENNDSFGDGNEKIITFGMVLIFFLDRFKINIERESIIAALMLDLPKTIKPLSVSGAQFNKCELTLKGVNTDNKDVLTQEYVNKDIDIKQSYVLGSYEYEVKLTYSKGCFTLC